MSQKLECIRNRLVPYVIWLAVPLEVMTFIWEQDSLPGKALLAIKLAFVGILYGLYFFEIPKTKHCFLAIAAVSMGVSVVVKGGAGVFALILILFMALSVFPLIRMTRAQHKVFYTALGCGAMLVILNSLFTNLYMGRSLLALRESSVNGNTLGMTVLGAALYFFTALDAVADRKWRYLGGVLICCASVALINCTGCRSALITLAVFVVLYVLQEAGKKTNWAFVTLAIASAIVAIVISCLSKLLGLGFANDTLGLYNISFFNKSIFSGRDLLWHHVLEGIQSSPLIGVSSDWLAERSGLFSAHNVYLGIFMIVGCIPALIYLYFILSPKSVRLLSPREGCAYQTGRIAFMACLTLAAFECALTDNRLNFLILPLLLSNCPAETGNEASCPQTEKHTSGKLLPKVGWLLLFIVSLLMIILYGRLSTRDDMIDDHTQSIRNSDALAFNLLETDNTPPKLLNLVNWKWEDGSVVVSGTAAGSSTYDLYNDPCHMPDWYVPGHRYTLLFESDVVIFRVLWYDEEGTGRWIADAHTDQTFTVPDEAKGLLVGLMVFPQDFVHEKVFPVLYDETAYQK